MNFVVTRRYEVDFPDERFDELMRHCRHEWTEDASEEVAPISPEGLALWLVMKSEVGDYTEFVNEIDTIARPGS